MSCGVLLGRPWQFDVDATHKGRENVFVEWERKRIKVVTENVQKSSKVEGKTFLIVTSSICDLSTGVKKSAGVCMLWLLNWTTMLPEFQK